VFEDPLRVLACPRTRHPWSESDEELEAARDAKLEEIVRKLNDPRLEEVVRLRAGGLTLAEVGRRLGISGARVRQLLREQLPKALAGKPQALAELRAVSEGRVSAAEAAGRLGCSRPAVYRALRRLGLEDPARRATLEEAAASGMSCRELGRRLGCSPVAAARHLRRLRQETAARPA
jgi:DNA-binding CsgD family transcriptional regulator